MGPFWATKKTAAKAAVLLNRDNSALAELGSATGSLEAVLKLSFTQFSLIFRAFQRFRSPVILFITDKKW